VALTGDEAENLRAHSEAICADYLNAVRLPGESLSLTVELFGPEDQVTHLSARDIERAGHGLRIGVRIGDSRPTFIETADLEELPDEVVLDVVAAVLKSARKRAARRR